MAVTNVESFYIGGPDRGPDIEEQIAKTADLQRAYNETLRAAIDQVTDNFIDAIAQGKALGNIAEVASQLSALRHNLRP